MHSLILSTSQGCPLLPLLFSVPLIKANAVRNKRHTGKKGTNKRVLTCKWHQSGNFRCIVKLTVFNKVVVHQMSIKTFSHTLECDDHVEAEIKNSTSN